MTLFQTVVLRPWGCFIRIQGQESGHLNGITSPWLPPNRQGPRKPHFVVVPSLEKIDAHLRDPEVATHTDSARRRCQARVHIHLPMVRPSLMSRT